MCHSSPSLCVSMLRLKGAHQRPFSFVFWSRLVCVQAGARLNNRSNDSLLRGPCIINDSNITGSRSLGGELRYTAKGIVHSYGMMSIKSRNKKKKTPTAPIFFFIFCLWLLVPLSTGSISLMSNIISRWSKHAAVTKKPVVNKLRKYLSSSRTEAVHIKAFKRLK